LQPIGFLFKTYETRHFSGYCRPHPTSDPRADRRAGNDPERDCGALRHDPPVHIQTYTHPDRMRAPGPKASRPGIFYELKIDKMNEIDVWLAQFRKIMEERFQQLDDVLFTLKNTKNESAV